MIAAPVAWQRATGDPTVVISHWLHLPAFLLLAGDVGSTGFILRVQRIKILIVTLLGRLARSFVGPFARNALRLRDRWSVIDAVLYWLSSYTFRLACLTYPLLYWYFGVTVVNAEAADVIGYFSVYYFWVLLAMNAVARGLVVPVLNDVSQILGAIPIARAAVVGLIKPNGHPFTVTAKGGDRSHIVFPWALMRPYLILLGLTLGGLLIGALSDWYAFNDAGQGKAVVLFWTLYKVLVLAVTLITFVELLRRERHVADTPEKTRPQIKGEGLPVTVMTLTKDILRYVGLAHPLGTVGHISLDGFGDVVATVIGANAPAAFSAASSADVGRIVFHVTCSSTNSRSFR